MPPARPPCSPPECGRRVRAVRERRRINAERVNTPRRTGFQADSTNLIDGRTALGDKAHDDRPLAACHEAETHFRAARQHDQPRLWRFVVTPVDLGRLVGGALVQVTAGGRDLLRWIMFGSTTDNNSLDVVRPAFCVDRLFPAVRELNVAAPVLGRRQPAGRCGDVTAE